MTDIIYSEGGTIDKYEGDAIIAFWNAPLDLADHPKHAVMSAIRCNKKLEELRPILKEKYGRDLFARIGINTGKVVVGNMGSTQRFNYTFLGDAGNLASRLEGQNKTFGTSIMISEFTFKMLGDDIAAREISSIRVVGKKVPIRVYEPMIKEDFAAKADLMKKYGEALQLYYKGQFKEALAIFSQLSSIDAPSASYVKRCKDLIDNPPENWDGVWEMKEK
jgi:adenylate cyclase